MSTLTAALWGAAGGFSVEILQLYAQIRSSRRWSWRKPIPQGLVAYIISVMVRVGTSSALTAAMAATGQLNGSIAAFTIGVAAPIIVERLARTVPLSNELREELPSRVGRLKPSDQEISDGIERIFTKLGPPESPLEGRGTQDDR